MYYFIINPHSQTGKGRQLWISLKPLLEKESISYESFFTTHKHHATKLATTICNTDLNPKVIVIVGGDGTVNEVLNGITDFKNITLGYIPTGSSNDFARGLHLPKDPKDALMRIIHPKKFRFIDYGVVSSTLSSKHGSGHDVNRFLVSAGIGYDASICNEALGSPIKTYLNKLHLGKLTYIFIALKQLITYQPTDATLLVNNTETIHKKNLIFLAAMNEQYEGGGLSMAPNSSDDDGLLSVCIVSNISKFKILLLMPTIFFGKHTSFRGVDILHCHSLEVKTTAPKPLHTDGEVSMQPDHIHLTAMHKKIRMII